MPPQSSRKRRAVDEDEDEVATPTQTQRSRPQEASPEYDEDDAEENQHNGAGSLPQLSKNLVRYALACEYSRTPIKRADITSKVMGLHKTAKFKDVFDHANSQLMDTFGMMMVELPNREKVTMKQKRAQAISETQSQRGNQGSNIWVLQSTLPDQYRTSDILSPAQIPTSEDESAYVGLYTMIITLILLSGGRITESRLDRNLKRMNADDSTPVDTRERLFARMIKDGYIVRIKDSSSGEDVVDYMVGPRGKVEVGGEAVKKFVRVVVSDAATDDLEQRLDRSLKFLEKEAEAQQAANAESATQKQAGRARQLRRRAADSEED